MIPDILILTPTLGDRKSLLRTISSVRTIGGERVKHVLVAPQDKSEQLKERYPNIEIMPEPKDSKGIYSALNAGFYAYGKNFRYIGFINDDDYWLPNFKQLISILDNDPTLDLVYAKTYYVNEQGAILKRQTCYNQFYAFLPLLQRNIVFLTQQATLLKSEWFFRLGGFSEQFKLVSDTKFWVDLSLCKPKYKYVDVYCAGYTIQDSQLSADKKLQKYEHTELLKMYPRGHFLKLFYCEFVFRIINLNTYILNYVIHRWKTKAYIGYLNVVI
jgi:hypothetical protein